MYKVRINEEGEASRLVLTAARNGQILSSTNNVTRAGVFTADQLIEMSNYLEKRRFDKVNLEIVGD